MISLRKQANRNKPFEHQAIEGLAEMANLLQYTDRSKSDEETAAQITEGAGIVVKRSLSETESMDVDEEGPHKRTKLLQIGEIIDEEVSDGSKRGALVPLKAVQVSQFSFKSTEGDVDSSELCHVFKSKEDLKPSYMEKRK